MALFSGEKYFEVRRALVLLEVEGVLERGSTAVGLDWWAKENPQHLLNPSAVFKDTESSSQSETDQLSTAPLGVKLQRITAVMTGGGG